MTATEPRPLADLEQDAIAAIDEEMARRAHGAKPLTLAEYVDRIEQVHVRYNHRRRWLANYLQEAA